MLNRITKLTVSTLMVFGLSLHASDNKELSKDETIKLLVDATKKLIIKQKELEKKVEILMGQVSVKPSADVIDYVDNNDSRFYIVKTGKLNVREEPIVNFYNIISRVNLGEIVEAKQYNSEWVKTKEGYISKSFLEEIKPSDYKRIYLLRDTPLRSTAKKVNSNIIKIAKKGDLVRVVKIDKDKNWFLTINGNYIYLD